MTKFKISGTFDFAVEAEDDSEALDKLAEMIDKAKSIPAQFNYGVDDTEEVESS